MTVAELGADPEVDRHQKVNSEHTGGETMSVGRRNRCLFSCLNDRKCASGVQILMALFKFLQKVHLF